MDSVRKRHIERALDLAWAALGTTSPNPTVGCVVARGDAVISEGWTQPPGQDHAEAMALRLAGENACGATLYVTLEPCNHYGRTPPCAESIIAAGIREVHIAVEDPNPNVAGGGAARLREAGITVHIGEYPAHITSDAHRLIEAFVKHSNTRMPFVIAKYAMSLDGKIAARTGDSKWISGEQSRGYAHLLRKRSDAIMVGINTVLADNPQLTARDSDGNSLEHQPLRVVLDSNARMPHNAAMLRAPGDTLVVVADADPDDLPAWDGAETVSVPSGANGGVDMRALLATLGERDITGVLVEGGGAVIGSLFDLRLVDKVVAFVAPVIIGGRDAISPVAGAGIDDMADAMRLRDVQMLRFGEDIAIIGYTGAYESVGWG